MVLLLILMVCGAFLLGEKLAQKNIVEKNFSHFVTAFSSPRTGELQNLYSLYLSISEFEGTDKLAVEAIGDIHYCRNDIAAAMLNYRLSQQLIVDEGKVVSDDSHLGQKIAALEAQDFDAIIFTDYVVC